MPRGIDTVPVPSPVFLPNIGPILRRLDRRSATWMDRRCPICESTMHRWQADATFLLGYADDQVDMTFQDILVVGGVPAVHCACDAADGVHLFANVDSSDTDEQVIREMAKEYLSPSAEIGQLVLRSARPWIQAEA